MSALHEKVKALEEREKSLRELAGEMIATIRINFDSGSITSKDDAHLRALLEKWDKWFATTHPEGPRKELPAERCPVCTAVLRPGRICPRCKAPLVTREDPACEPA